MDIIWWLIIILSFIFSYVGLVYPVLPSPLFLWISVLVYQFAVNGNELGLWYWITMVVLTIVLLISDIIINSKAVKHYGGTKWGERMAAIGVIIGSFVFPPFGVILVPFIFVFITEYIQKEDLQVALQSSKGAIIGFLGGTLAKFIIQTFIIGWFILNVTLL
ncbi:membrane protein [Pontibacillus chungwhensis BH030062]|uniref:Membrane protein n=1 Tax=Pontibacillus chungwhensis BH030062 TaxID=1385513 RepID=A0A0A2V329_9BACI|nr:DUF456 domain-containing protein [Pontibacillus chungwhensis]KGP93221.1 membrane protein [Pontibacillus chungwhensis BH030062]